MTRTFNGSEVANLHILADFFAEVFFGKFHDVLYFGEVKIRQIFVTLIYNREYWFVAQQIHFFHLNLDAVTD